MSASPRSLKTGTWLRVLASGSSGNCAIIVHQPSLDTARRVWLVDAGLSPRRTTSLLGSIGLTLRDVEGAFVTHLDTDHWHPGWRRAMPEHVRVLVHPAHTREMAAADGPGRSAACLDGPTEISPAVTASAMLADHDGEGVAVFRFHFPHGSLGYATDIGRPTRGVIEHLRGVDVLAIESNYCPLMQRASPRPAFLKRRIMGGFGHLSNQQSAAAAREIGPKSHVVLLHLSRQCNRPELAAREHESAPYGVTIASQHSPTPWVRIQGDTPGAMPATRTSDGELFQGASVVGAVRRGRSRVV